ncbi:metal-dependent hydrolase [Mycobacteroides abscessus subsp. abscessus]|nr:metal-dependent hydrolase [Mycobacteroides abscessus subsp. abscessus]
MKQMLKSTEYAPYYSRYVDLVPEGDLTSILLQQMKETVDILKGLTEQQAHFSYGVGKWSIKEVIGHITDTERIMGYRLLSFARGEKAELPGYDDNEYVRNAYFNSLFLQDLLENFEITRESTLQLIKSLPKEAYIRRGKANGSDVSVRALVCIIAGHELHHRKLIKERYIGSKEFPQ